MSKISNAKQKAAESGYEVFTGEVRNKSGFNADRSNFNVGDAVSIVKDQAIIKMSSRRNNRDYAAVDCRCSGKKTPISWNAFIFSNWYTTDPKFNLAAVAGQDPNELVKEGKLFTAYRYGLQASKATIEEVIEVDTETGETTKISMPIGLPETITFDAEAYQVPTQWNEKTSAFEIDEKGKLRLTAFVADGVAQGEYAPLAEEVK
jgi:hypothetical protein